MPFAFHDNDEVIIQDIFGTYSRKGTLRPETAGAANVYVEFDEGVSYYFKDQMGPEYVEWTHWVIIPKRHKKYLVKTRSRCVYVERGFVFMLTGQATQVTNTDLPRIAINCFKEYSPQYDLPHLTYEAHVTRSGNHCMADIEVRAEDGFDFQDPFGVNEQI